MTNDQKCDVCNEKAIGVASSTLGAISFAYCYECNESGAEPYGLLVGIIEMLYGKDWKKKVVADKYTNKTIDATLKAVNKTRDEFENDVDKFIEEQLQEVMLQEQIEYLDFDSFDKELEGDDEND